MNTAWAKSGETQIEFTHALRLNLTSHERGATKSPHPRRPILLPVSFSGLVWSEHPDIDVLSSRTNFIVHNSESLMEGDKVATLQQVALSLAAYGIKKMDLKPLGLDIDQDKLGKLREQEVEVTSKDLIKELNRTIQEQTAHVRHLEHRLNNMKLTSFVEHYNPTLLRANYIGGCANIHLGCEKVWALDYTFVQHRDQMDGNMVPLTGTMVAKCLSCRALSGSPEAVSEVEKMAVHIDQEHTATVNLKGGFYTNKGLVWVDAFEYQDNPHSLIALCQYRLVINIDGSELVGVFDRGDPTWTATVRLRAY